MKKAILLTGATGFLGSHLLKTLLLTNNFHIFVAKRSKSDLSRIRKVCNEKLLSSNDLEFFDVDSEKNIERVFAENSIEIIINTATNYGKGDVSLSSILTSNLIFPLSLLDCGIKNGLKLFINTDSYFNKSGHEYMNLRDYSLSKKSLNIWLEYLSNKTKIVNLRLEHIYGDFDRDDKFCEMLFQSIVLRREKSLRLTCGQQMRDFIHVDDVCEAYLAVLENYEKSFFNYLMFDVGTGKSIYISDFVKAVKEFSNSDTELLFGALPYREDEIMCSKADILGLKNWGFEAKISYSEGIKKILDLYKSRGMF